MARKATPYTIKCELLKSLIEKIQCHICKSVPGLVEDQQNRYVCKKGHCLCENCKNRICPSPCGSTGSNPNPAIQHLLKDLPAYCTHFKNGCTTIFSDSENRDDHMKGCTFRKVNCPSQSLSFSCKNQILFKDLSDHVKTFHKEHLKSYVKSNGNKFDVTYSLFSKLLSKFDSSDDSHWWNLKQLKTNDGSVFYAVSIIENKSVYHWIYFLGSPQEVKHYQLSQSITYNDDGEKIIYQGKVHTLDTSAKDIIEKGSALIISGDIVKRCSDLDNKFKIDVEIRCLKQEAINYNYESDLYDEETKQALYDAITANPNPVEITGNALYPVNFL